MISIDFIPTPAIALSLLGVVSLPFCLLVLSHGPWKVPAPGRRFVLSAGLTVMLWIGLMFVPTSPVLVDVISGGLLLATALLAGFTLWTLVAWGFTVSMLLSLSRAGVPLTPEEWVLRYTGGTPVDAFARDRLGVLFRLGLAQAQGDQIVMTPGRGRRMARVVVLLRQIFGLPQ
jgi:hypothetical protein